MSSLTSSLWRTQCAVLLVSWLVLQACNGTKPNFVFILADDLGYGDVGYHGGEAHTPHLNTMAKGPNSARFKYFYSGAPVCTPTRGTVLTGRNHNRYCLWMANTPGRKCKDKVSDFVCPAQVFLPSSEVTVAELLKNENYTTAVFGKWHLGDLKKLSQNDRSNPSDNGFDVWKVTERSAPSVTPNCACLSTSLCSLGHYGRKGPPPCTNYYSGNGTSDDLIPHPELIMDDSEFIVDNFETFLQDTVAKDKPFFAYLPLHGVHHRYIASQPYSRHYQGLDSNKLDYYSTITAVDSAVGRVRQLLKEANVSENTMVWFTSDNGPAKNTPGSTAGLSGRKGSIQEGGIRVPGIIEFPQLIKTNLITSVPVVTMDFLPTVCDLVGIKPPKQLDGESVVPFLQKTSISRTSTIKWAYNVKGDFNKSFSAAIMDGHNKLVARCNKGRCDNSALYNVRLDKAEQHKLYPPLPKGDFRNKDYRTFRRLNKELEEWLKSVKKSAQTCLGTD